MSDFDRIRIGSLVGARPAEMYASAPYGLVEGEDKVLSGFLVSKALGGGQALDVIGGSDSLLLLGGTGRDGGCADCLVEAGILRDYQGKVIEDVLQSPIGRGLVKAPCGSGKTRLAGALCCGFQRRLGGSGRWAYVVPNRELASQTQAALTDSSKGFHGIALILAMWAGIGGRGTCPDLRCFSFGEIWYRHRPGRRYEEFLSCTEGLLVDEVHAAIPVNRANAILRSRAVVRLGLSATPTDRGDGLGFVAEGLFGPILGEISLQEVTDAGYLTPASVRH